MTFLAQEKVSYDFRKGNLDLRFSGNGQKSPNKFGKTTVPLEKPNRYKFYSAA